MQIYYEKYPRTEIAGYFVSWCHSINDILNKKIVKASSMDQLKLCWESRPSRHKKAKAETVLAVYVNDVSIEQLLQEAAERNNARTLGDVFINSALVQELLLKDWQNSCHQAGFITLMACACGQWECSTICVKTTQQANWVHWQFHINDVYLKTYGQLPEFWFDAGDYTQALQTLDQLSRL
jgi:hypothetical protein